MVILHQIFELFRGGKSQKFGGASFNRSQSRDQFVFLTDRCLSRFKFFSFSSLRSNSVRVNSNSFKFNSINRDLEGLSVLLVKPIETLK